MTPTAARALIAGLTYSEKLQLLALLRAIKKPPATNREHSAERPNRRAGRLNNTPTVYRPRLIRQVRKENHYDRT